MTRGFRFLVALPVAGLLLPYAGGGQPARPAPPSAGSVVWGPVAAGLQAGIRIPSARVAFRHGDLVQAEVRIRNTSNRSLSLSAPLPFIWHPERTGERIDLEARGSGARAAGATDLLLTAGEQMAVPLSPPAVILRQPGWKGDPTDHTAPTLELAPGAYRLGAECTFSSGSGEEALRVATGLVEFRVVPGAPAAESPSLKALRVVWGELKDGMQLGSAFERASSLYRRGDAVRFTLLLRNAGRWPRKFQPAIFRPGDALPVVRDQGGRPVPVHVVRSTIPLLPDEGRLLPSEARIVSHPELLLLPQDGVPPVTGIPSISAEAGRYTIVHEAVLGLHADPKLLTTLRTGELTLRIADRPSPRSE